MSKNIYRLAKLGYSTHHEWPHWTIKKKDGGFWYTVARCNTHQEMTDKLEAIAREELA